MKTKKLLTLLGAGFIACSIAACGHTDINPTPDPDPDPTPDDKINPDNITDNVTLSMSVNYDKSTGMKYNQSTEYTTPNGTKIGNGDFKPVWRTLQSNLNFTINDVTDTNKKAVEQFKNDWDTNAYADIACGNVSDIVSSSVKGTSESILNIKEYLKYMPNFSKFLEENPIVKLSIETADHDDANATAIYYMPYFDGFADLEKMTLLRADWVRKILDEDNLALDTDVIWSKASYTSTFTTDSYSVDVTRNGKSVKVTKQKVEKGIIELQNEASSKNANTLVPQFREYLKARYEGQGYEKLSDIFLGTDAAYDADEMIALMRVVRSAPLALTGSSSNEIVPFVPREYNNQRIADLYRWAGQLWGVRGVESRNGYLYFDSEGKLHDGRGEKDTVEMIENLHKLYEEGLILQNFEAKEGYGQSDGKYGQVLIGGDTDKKGFMEYDYAQTQGAWNDKKHADTNFDFRPIVGGVADWDDGTNGNYIHFTESWRSVKTQGWCLNASLAAEGNEAKLSRALKLIDYFYSEEGHNLNSFGPESEGYIDGTTTYLGKEIPAFSAKALEQLNDTSIGGGSYTNYLRKFVGATLPIGYVKEQGMEYQCTSANALNGLKLVNEAITAGTFQHVECAVKDNMFYTIAPSAFFLSSGETTTKNGLEDKSKLGSINTNSSTSAYCMWDKYVINGFGATTSTETLYSQSEYLTLINDTWGLDQLVALYEGAWELMLAGLNA